MEKTLNVQPVAPAQAFERLAITDGPRASTTGGAETVAEKCRHAYVFEVTDGERQVGAYAIRLIDHDRVRVAWITAAAGAVDGVDLPRTLWPAVLAQCQAMGAGQIAFNTRRRGLIRKAERLGFQLTAVTLRKSI